MTEPTDSPRMTSTRMPENGMRLPLQKHSVVR